MSEAEQAMMQEYMKLNMPGEHHKALDVFVGKWNTVTKMWMGGPGSQVMEWKGTSEIKWILGERFLLEEHQGEMMGMPYLGMGMTGYDNYRNMYFSTWANNMSTFVLTMTGACDPSGKNFTYFGEMDEPALKITGRTVKYLTKILSPDSHVLEVIDLHHPGDNYKVIEVTYARAK